MRYGYLIAMMCFSFIMTYVLIYLMVREADDFALTSALFDQAMFIALAVGVAELVAMHALETHNIPPEEEKFDIALAAGMILIGGFLVYRIRNHTSIKSSSEFYHEMIPLQSMSLRIMDNIRTQKWAQNDPALHNFLKKVQPEHEQELAWMKKQISCQHSAH